MVGRHNIWIHWRLTQIKLSRFRLEHNVTLHLLWNTTKKSHQTQTLHVSSLKCWNADTWDNKCLPNWFPSCPRDISSHSGAKFMLIPNGGACFHSFYPRCTVLRPTSYHWCHASNGPRRPFSGRAELRINKKVHRQPFKFLLWRPRKHISWLCPKATVVVTRAE